MTAYSADPIYLDHNATTPTDPRVLAAMLPYFTEVFGNPSSVEHVHGHRAQAAVATARAQVAKHLGARENEIIFTGSCTEASNIAILGASRARPERRHLITTAIEHPAVLEPFRQLEREGYELTILPVDDTGRVNPATLERAMRDDTGLVSVMAANNEVGTTQDIAKLGEIAERRGALFHTDVAQLLAHRKVDVVSEHIHLASISGHKAYGPKGIGALYARSRMPRARIEQTVWGGGQERGLRSGTLAVPLIVGLGEALEIASREGDREGQRLRDLCDAFVERVTGALEGVFYNGHPEYRIPGNVSLSIAGVEPLALMHRLNGVASFSASSACATDKVRTSHVLLAMFGDTQRARGAFRISPGRSTAKSDLLRFADGLIEAVGELRRFAA
ncbi:cysteine desulfurase family protein [Sphingomonas arenae]|uniref:cysteine desulfurase family protein n=1 Tax=Sphingomonas arenae TaxID=2812555 RepID=UPI001967D61D|nr:cysteine desulfurase family protein [Sphingomonas arenae]